MFERMLALPKRRELFENPIVVVLWHPTQLLGLELNGRTLGIVGAGRICVDRGPPIRRQREPGVQLASPLC